MQTKGTSGALSAIVGSVVGVSHSFRYRVIVVGVAVAVVIAVASIPTTVSEAVTNPNNQLLHANEGDKRLFD